MAKKKTGKNSQRVTVGVAQFAPVVLNLRGSVAQACAIIARAGREGIQILAFPETWLPVYPIWADMGSFGRWDYPPAKKLHARLIKNSLQVGGAEFKSLASAVRKAGIWVTIGVNEREGRSLYNSLLTFEPGGALVNHHRKLVPTFGERLVWSHGDAQGLRVVPTPYGPLGGLICWEHWMPPARQALHELGEVLHVAAWPHGKERHQLASRHYAFEGRCFVLAAAMVLPKSAFPNDYELREEMEDLPDLALEGGSAVIGPDGRYILEPLFDREDLIAAEIDTARAMEESLTLDVAGHYSRPDVFDLTIHRIRKRKPE
jgi:predicted amidohydrolase